MSFFVKFSFFLIKTIQLATLIWTIFPLISLAETPKQAPITNDPEVSKQWYLERIGAPLFWNRSTGSSTVQVLLCDTGVDSHHPDLRDNLSLPGINFVDGTDNTEPTGSPHGTHMAGIIGALGNNGLGISGVAWNIKIIPGKISNDPKGATEHSVSAKCIRWGADHGVRIVNLSIGGALDNPEVIDASKYLHSKGGILFMSAGNNGYPKEIAGIPEAIAVSASDKNDWLAYWSGSGPFVDLAAPGSEIYTTEPGGGYKMDKGTSCSTALTSGAAALILSLNPRLSADELMQVLLNSATDLGKTGWDQAYGHGRLNLGKALELLEVYGKGGGK
jgi:subtilisin family serine protease